MFFPLGFITRFLPCCAAVPGESSKLQEVMTSDSIAILSASCCDSGAAKKDISLKKNLEQALLNQGIDKEVLVETITAAQRGLRALEQSADPLQKQLIGNVVSLFQSNGLSVFPMAIINGRVAFYGGVPTVEMIEKELQKSSMLSTAV